MAFVEIPRNLLREPLNLCFLRPLCVVVIESREDMFLVKLVKIVAFGSNVGKNLGNLVCNLRPARWEHVHLNHGVTIVFV